MRGCGFPAGFPVGSTPHSRLGEPAPAGSHAAAPRGGAAPVGAATGAARRRRVVSFHGFSVYVESCQRTWAREKASGAAASLAFSPERCAAFFWNHRFCQSFGSFPGGVIQVRVFSLIVPSKSTWERCGQAVPALYPCCVHVFDDDVDDEHAGRRTTFIFTV
jgi:hypothetical protein